jgi:tetratricopeptide (TPR) repeat protein
VHHLTAPLRSRGTIGYYASWILTLYGYLLVVWGLLSAGTAWLGPEGGDPGLPLWEPSSWIILLVLGAVSGIALGRGARGEAAPTEPQGKRGLLTFRNVLGVMAGLLLLGAILLGDAAGPSTPAEWEAALPALEADARERPSDPRAQRDLAWALVNLDGWDEAGPVLERAVRFNPDDADLHNSLGWARMREEKHGEAVPLLRRAVRLRPEHPFALHNLAWSLHTLGEAEEAEGLYREILRRNPEDVGARSGLGWVLLARFHPQEAEAAFREALQRDRSNAWHHRGLAQSRMQQGRFGEALAAYREAVRIGPEAAVLWADIGHVAHLHGEHADASDAFARAERLDSTYFAADTFRRALWEASRQGREFVPSER